jgi:hypothetical protein
MDFHFDIQGARDRIHSYVVMRWANAAGGEQIIVPGAQNVDSLDDRIAVIGDHAHLAQADALHVEPGCDLRDILVLGSAGQDFISNHDQGGSPDAFGCRHGQAIAFACAHS